MVAARTPKTLNGANTKTLNGEITVGGMRDDYRLFQSHMGFFSQISRTDISEGRARDRERRQNTSSHAHFFSVLSCRVRRSTVNHAHMCMFRVACCSIAHSTLLGVIETFSSFCSSPSQTTLTNTTADWNQECSLCYFARRKSVWLLGRITPSHRL